MMTIHRNRMDCLLLSYLVMTRLSCNKSQGHSHNREVTQGYMGSRDNPKQHEGSRLGVECIIFYSGSSDVNVSVNVNVSGHKHPDI